MNELATPLLTRKQRYLWTLGNLLMFAGMYVLVYVGGLYAQEAYYRAAARGDSDLPLPLEAAVETLPAHDPQAMLRAPQPFQAPELNIASTQPVDLPVQPVDHSTITRIQIPSIDVDSKVVEVGWTVQDGATVWQVAKFAVGHHQGSANPGAGDNIVMAGHVGGAGPVFARLIEVEPGAHVVLYAEGQQYVYVVQDVVRVQEVGVSDEQRLRNAAYMHPTETEMVTLITCWPAAGPHAFDQRIIVQAVPFSSTQSQTIHSWSLR